MEWFVFLLLADAESSSGTNANGQRRLNRFVRHFEPVVYDHKELQSRHERVRRSVDDPNAANGPEAVHLRFRSHNR